MENKPAISNFIRNIVIQDLESGKHSEIITRFPPEPNGYLHIGHAKSIVLNFELADEFNGKTYLRFDDTNPTKEEAEYVESIKEDVKWLGFQWDALYFASDYFQEMYERALLLIKKGLAYVDDLSAEEIREYRGTLTEPGKESPYRNRTIEENLDLFER
ncbi:MAG: glutamate--tRNA ligase family protein, partial [Candidatus Alkaliphilus sp. MAG34]